MPTIISSFIPDDENSIFLEGLNKEKLLKLRGRLSWMEIEKFYNKKNINIFGINNSITQPEEIKQGKLGSSYLISAIASLVVTKPYMIKELFETGFYNKKGLIAVRLLVQGEPNLIFLDSNFPVCIKKNKKPGFSFCKNGEIWVAAIEKAWAKINGKCYAKTYLGTPYEAFNSLVFAPTYFYFHKKYISRNRADLVWNKLLDAKAKRFAITANIEEMNDSTDFSGPERENQSIVGNQSNNQSNINLNIEQSSNAGGNQNKLNNNQAYAVLDIYEFEEVKLIKIWSPKGKVKDWNGEYCHNNENWSRELMNHTKYKHHSSIFYATFEEYIKYFAWTYICKNEENFIYRTLKSNNYPNKNNQDSVSEPAIKAEDDDVKEVIKVINGK